MNSGAMWLLRTRTVTGCCSRQLIPAFPPSAQPWEPSSPGAMADPAELTVLSQSCVIPGIITFQCFGCLIDSALATLYSGKLLFMPQSLTANVFSQTGNIVCQGTQMTTICIYFSPQHPGHGVGILFPDF